MGLKIAFVGRSQQTKTFAARYLIEKHGFQEMNLTEAVFRCVRMLYPFEQFKQVTWEQRVKFYDALYSFDKNIMIEFLKKRLDDPRTKDSKRSVVCDVRYLNEVKALKELGFVIVQIEGTKKSGAQLNHVKPSDLILTQWYNKDAIDFIGIDYTIRVTGYIRGESKDLDQLIKSLTSK